MQTAAPVFVDRCGIRPLGLLGIAILLMALPGPACAHFFVQSYSLPVPFWMYAWGAAVALLLSFIAAAVFVSVPSIAPAARGRSVAVNELKCVPYTASAGSYFALVLLVLCIVSGFTGPARSVDNFNMTFFWIIFVLGVPYVTAFAGDFYSRVNPWEALVILIQRLSGHPFAGWVKHPGRWGHWPAVVLYAGFINVELFGNLLPRALAGWLLAYSAINIAGAWLLGRQAWFEQGEFFGVLLRLIGRMAPLRRTASGLKLCMPFSGLLEDEPFDLGLVVFVLFMLASTAFDGLHSTRPWVNLYWSEINPHLVGGLGLSPREQTNLSVTFYGIWQRIALVASPFIYLALFAATIALMDAVVRSGLAARALLFKFALCIIPIAFVYHVTHYFTLLLAQGAQMVRLISDPFGLGWNLFGTANWAIPPVMIEMAWLWHFQVACILAGHVASVWAAHVAALTIYRTQRRAAFSQLPMLVLMMVFTAFGLWILSLPMISS